MSESVTIDLPQRITIAQVESLHEMLEPALNDGCDVVLNGGNVSQVDTAGLQTLLAFAKALEKRSAQLKWSSSSKALKDAAAQLGLQKGLCLH